MPRGASSILIFGLSNDDFSVLSYFDFYHVSIGAPTVSMVVLAGCQNAPADNSVDVVRLPAARCLVVPEYEDFTG